MTEPRRGMLPSLVFAIVVTSAVSGLRLYGELQQWDPRWFNREAGGGGALLGISWLVIVFGLWFGWRLARNGDGPASRGKAILLPLAGFGAVIGFTMLQFTVLKLEGWTMAVYLAVASGACCLLGLLAWPRLFAQNLVYGLFARLPIVPLTYLAVEKGWDVHHAKLPPNAAAMDDAARAFSLSVAQVCLWIPFTILIGGTFGGIAALFVKRRPA